MFLKRLPSGAMSPSLWTGLRIQQAIVDALVRNAENIATAMVYSSKEGDTTKDDWVKEFSDPEYWSDAAEIQEELVEIYSGIIRRIEFTKDGPKVYTHWVR